ncbi:DNA replication initiator [Thermoplasma volcanium GSS1]|uniref:DNA helicase n=1 Tax=Thermoplasma volcanium (strain ATCC 51530 / DSM 4299 / JCM 9571 / NBRC 15438 / GSS1) TaxID=273116 RepID=Q979U9_THEVO|nr:minichromosome maintenance protein MCM [Thermoplasma volcanium]BAB60203.1 DNA replication initiator [Thermoplasma volcanium GSS1]
MISQEMPVERIKDLWRDFFRTYGYSDKINSIHQDYPEVRTLYVSFKDIEDYDRQFAASILASPEIYLKTGEEIVMEDYLLDKVSRRFRIFHLRIKDLEDRNTSYNIRDIRSANIGTLISVSGIVRKNTEVFPKLKNAAFECSNCHELNYVEQNESRLTEPLYCANCGQSKVKDKISFKLRPNLSEFIDVQKIEIQEDPETLEGGAQPQRLIIIVEDDLAGLLFPGNRVVVDGILQAEQRRQGNVPLTEFYTFLYAVNIRKDVKEIESVKITEEDKQKIIEISKRPNVIDVIAKSIAPTIHGLDMIKKALALQMFGGVRKTMKDGTTMRGDIHILMVGDPGTAKSQLLKYMAEVSPRGIFTFGRGSSAAGLTAAAVRDEFGEGRWTLEAGALVLADNGFVAIDELDKMDEHDTAAMHEAMEQQTVTISKAGIMATLRARASVLAAANPKFGRYDLNRNLAEQINFPLPLLSRFDVIFKMVDQPNKDTDSQLAEHVLKAHRLGEIYKSMEKNDIEIDVPDEAKYEPDIDKDLLRKYVAYAKNNVFPRLSDEAIAILQDQYVRTRTGSRDSIPITVRQLESTIRLAEAAARARLSTIVTVEDAMLAKKIVDYYLTDVSTENGKMDIDIIYTGSSSKQRNEMETVLDIIKEIKEEKGIAEVSDVIGVAESKGITAKKAEEAILKLKNAGQIFERSYGKLDVIK